VERETASVNVSSARPSRGVPTPYRGVR
jgi:hypothetical protein